MSGPPRRERGQKALKARALQLLAQREHSRAELRRKLLDHAQRCAVSFDENAAAGADIARCFTSSDAAAQDAVADVDALLDWLEAQRWLSEERFIESRVRARASRFGHLRICRELKQHELVLPSELAVALKATELDRARLILKRRTAAANGTLATHSEQARQTRFLIGRGFAPDVVRRVVREAARPSTGDNLAVCEAGAFDDA